MFGEKCGKSLKVGGDFIDFVARQFRGWMNCILGLVIIGFAISGVILGSQVGSSDFQDFSIVYAFLGLIVGGFIGLFVAVLFGGLIANFLNMVDNIAILATNSTQKISTSNNNE